MFANVWGEEAQLEETVSTLRFGVRMMRVPISAAANQIQDPTSMVKRLEKEIRTLKQELSMHDTLNNKANQTYDAITDTQLAEINRQVKNFLEGASDNIDIVNIRQIQAVFGAFRHTFRNMEKEIEAKLAEKYELQEKQPGVGAGAGAGAGQVNGAPAGGKDSAGSGEVRYVGELDGQGFGVGVAGAGNKPAKSSIVDQKKAAFQAANSKKQKGKSSPRSSRDGSPSRGASPQADPGMRPPGTAGSGAPGDRPATPPPRHIAFEDFKKEEGAQLNKILNENKEILKSKVAQSRELANTINDIKRRMDQTRDQINDYVHQRETMGGFQGLDENERVVEESEYGLILQLKGLKREYREQYSELQKVRSEIQYCQKLVDQCRQRLISDFDNWYLQSYVGPNVEFTPTVQTSYGQPQPTTITSINDDEGEKMEEERTRLMLQDPDSYNYHMAKRATIRKFNQSKTAAQLEHNDGLIMPPKKPTQMILNAQY